MYTIACIDKCHFLKELFATKWVIAYYVGWMGGGMWLCKGRVFFSTSFHPFSKGEVNVLFTLLWPSNPTFMGENNRSHMTTQCSLVLVRYILPWMRLYIMDIELYKNSKYKKLFISKTKTVFWDSDSVKIIWTKYLILITTVQEWRPRGTVSVPCSETTLLVTLLPSPP